MLNIIHQNGRQKYESSTYFVDKSSTNSDSAEGESTYSIFVFVQGLDIVEAACYDKEETANAIFARMVQLENNNRLVVLPKDDPEEIAVFLNEDYTFKIFTQKYVK